MKKAFRATIQSAGGGGAYLDVPFDVEATFGKKRVPVHALIEGVPYRGTLVRMGGPGHMLPVLKAIREKVGKQVGDEVAVVLEEDTAPRIVEVPGDLSAALDAHRDARAAFDALSYSHQREYVLWIEGAKRAETREKRVGRTVELLREGRKLR